MFYILFCNNLSACAFQIAILPCSLPKVIFTIKFAHSLNYIIIKISLIVTTIFIWELALPIFFPQMEFSFIHIGANLLLAKSMRHSFVPLPLIRVWILKISYSPHTLGPAVFYLSFVVRSIWVYKYSWTWFRISIIV